MKSKQTSNKSIVISVSLGTGCYRHIRISMRDTFEDLAYAILEAFSFDNDHLHVFFMDNKRWSRENRIYMKEADPDNEFPHSCDVMLCEQDLKKGSVFKFVFDFGDNWQFQCKVLRFEEKLAKYPEVIRSVGDAPEQYPSFEDERYSLE